MSRSLRPHGLQHTRLPHTSLSQTHVFAQTHDHQISDAIQPSHPPSSSSPTFNLVHSIRVFSNESALHIRWPDYWSFSISTSKEYSGLISLRIDWFGLLAVQATLKSLLQHHSLKASILWPSAFFMVQPSNPYILIITLNVNRLNEPTCTWKYM